MGQKDFSANEIARLKTELRQAQRQAFIAKQLLSLETSLKRNLKRLFRKSPSQQSDFRNDNYQRYISRRLEHLASLGLPTSEKSVLEVGAGIGELTSFFLDRNCSVVATEVRPESLEILRDRHPGVDVRRLDLDNPASAGISEEFDIVFCYGVLYHLSRPAEAIAYMASRCRGMLLLETRVSFGTDPVLYPYPEAKDSPTQSATGLGCRPTRAWVFHELQKHFPHVYVPLTQPHRQHFPVDWSAEVDEDQTSNAIFIGARARIENALLSASLPARQRRDF